MSDHDFLAGERAHRAGQPRDSRQGAAWLLGWDMAEADQVAERLEAAAGKAMEGVE